MRPGDARGRSTGGRRTTLGRIARSLRFAYLGTALAVGPLPAQEADPLAEAQELLDAGRAQQAELILDAALSRDKSNARAYLLRSTARFVLGKLKGGEQDLERSLKLDPGLRQAWMNRAALRLAEEDYDAAHEAFSRARELDPTAPDNDLNLGVVLLLKGQLQAAGRSFDRHIEGAGGSSDAYYVVASNYAMSGYAAIALRHLAQAIDADERSRIRARTDPNFRDLTEDLRFQELMNTDRYAPPPGAYHARRDFESPYQGGQGALLGAVIDAMRRGNLPFSPQVEVTPNWALILGAMRVKVADREGKGVVELTAPPDSFSPAQWKELSQNLFQQIATELRPKVGLPAGAARRASQSQ